MIIPSGHLKLLTQIGYASVARKIGVDPAPIFDALVLLRPNHAAGAIGLALQALMARNLQGAIAVLERDGVNKKHSADEAKAFLMLAYKLSGDDIRSDALSVELGGAKSAAAQRFAAYVNGEGGEDGSDTGPTLQAAAG